MQCIVFACCLLSLQLLDTELEGLERISLLFFFFFFFPFYFNFECDVSDDFCSSFTASLKSIVFIEIFSLLCQVVFIFFLFEVKGDR